MIPRFTPSTAVADDADLLVRGALAPLTGFGPDGSGVTLVVPTETGQAAAEAGRLDLRDDEGAPIAVVTVESTYPTTRGTGVVGSVTAAGRREGRLLEPWHLSPADLPTGQPRLVVPLDRPPSDTDLERIITAAAGRPVLLLAMAGVDRPIGVSPLGLIRVASAAAGLLPDARVVIAPLARRRDTQVDAQLVEAITRAYAGTAGAAFADPVHGGAGALPVAIERAVSVDRPQGPDRGMVVLLTGLSGSGKSTVARGLRDRLVLDGRPTVTLLDGDVVRRNLSAGLGFSREDRDTNIRRIGWVAAEIGRHGGTAVCCPIAPFEATRDAVREMVAAAGAAFVLVHVATPLAECERRDRKGLYARARRGEIEDFTGISSPYEEPVDPDLRLDTTGRDIGDCVTEVMDLLVDRELVPAPSGEDTGR